MSSTNNHKSVSLESEHDQLIRLKERKQIFLEWLSSQHNYSEIDQLQEWEDFENQVIARIEKQFKFIFGE